MVKNLSANGGDTGDMGSIPWLGRSPPGGNGNLCYSPWGHKDLGFPGGSDGKESTCNVRDPGLISGLGRSPEEGDGYPLQYPWNFPSGSE